MHRLALSTERFRCTNRIAVFLLRLEDTEEGYTVQPLCLLCSALLC
jgi:hypothetical protein